MATTVEIELSRVTPSVEAVLSGLGIPAEAPRDERTLDLARDSIQLFRDLARPIGITAEISPDDFAAIYPGEGLNGDETPLEKIIPDASRLCLFAVTLGEEICTRIVRLFDDNDFAAGAMLDAAASAGADQAAEVLEVDYESHLIRTGALHERSGALRFSPGYCGWHVSGQKKLFAYLRPETIGIELNDSCLMQPLKSVSGVIVAGPVKLFDIDDTYPFCADCTTHSCKDRYALLMKRKAG